MTRIKHSYYVVMIDYGKRGREAIVDPEVTRREVVSRIASGEYQNIVFVHYIAGADVYDVTEEMTLDAEGSRRLQAAE